MFLKKLLKNGQVSIPKKIQVQLNIQDGDYLTIYQQTEGIAIKNQHHDPQLNQCIVSNGRISIPVELRRILKIKEQSNFLMEVFISEKKILLRHLID